MTDLDRLELLSLQPELKLHNLKENFRQYQRLLERIDSKQKIDVICFPEYWNGLRVKNYTDDSFEDSISFLQSIASTFTAWVVGGSQISKIGEKYVNRSCIINSNGKIIGTYDKHRLFGYELHQNMLAGKNPFHWNVWKLAGDRL